MGHQARVTVVIAARDAASTLPETLDSLAAQTFVDWEAILVDDASTDATATIAAGWDERLRVIRRDSPAGPAASRNEGIAAARTALVATLDADDRWEPRYLELQVRTYDRAAAEGRRVGLVCTDATLVDRDGRPQGRWSERIPLPSDPDLRILLRHNFVYNSVLLPRELFLAHTGYDPGLLRGEDYDLWLRIVESGCEIVVNPVPLAVYRLNPEGLSADTAALSAATREVYERALRRGRLTRPQRGLARRQARLHALVERRARRAEGGGAGGVLPDLRWHAAVARVALEHPERWAGWLRRGPRRAAAGRHA